MTIILKRVEQIKRDETGLWDSIWQLFTYLLFNNSI